MNTFIKYFLNNSNYLFKEKLNLLSFYEKVQDNQFSYLDDEVEYVSFPNEDLNDFEVYIQGLNETNDGVLEYSSSTLDKNQVDEENHIALTFEKEDLSSFGFGNFNYSDKSEVCFSWNHNEIFQKDTFYDEVINGLSKISEKFINIQNRNSSSSCDNESFSLIIIPDLQVYIYFNSKNELDKLKYYKSKDEFRRRIKSMIYFDLNI